MNECVAARYKKVKLFENVYIYIFKDIVRNVEYDVEEDTINYVKKGKKKVLYDITDPDFTASDEKYGFSDFFEIPELCEYYDTDNIEEAIVTFESECKTFFRFGIIDEEKQDIKLISSPTNKLLSVEGDSTFIDFSLEEVNSYGECVFLPIDSINVLINNLQNKKTDIALAQLNTIKNISDTYGEYIEDDSHLAISLQEENIDLEDIEKELASLIGLDNVKKEILKLKKYLEYLKKVEGKVNLDNPNLNMVFKGNPGTGKTTVAKLIGKMLYGLGYAKSAKFKETTAQDFIGEYVGQTGPKARNLINECKGGVILIDEAYVFASPGQEFAQEALVEIIKEMEKKETIFIFAGYKDEMKKFIDMNPGIKSRVGYYTEFNDYTVDELYQILERKIKRSKMKITPAVKKEIVKIIEQNKDKERFGNGRFIDQLFDKLIINHAYNFGNAESLKTLRTIRLEDLEGINDQLKDEKVKRKIGF